MKLRLIKLTPQTLIDALRGKTTTVLPNLPDDSELLDIKCDLFSNQILAIIRSNSFEDIAETYPIPELDAKTPTPTKPAPQPTTMIKPEPASAPIMKTQSPQTPTTTDTSMTEEEFTPDQRKLLSFKVEGDFVIVKPIQFLKAEWDDINDVVRSLGGRWVKGDIISYWEIPNHQS